MISGRLKVYITSFSEEVTGSNNHVKIAFPDGREVTFLVDCGLFQEKEHNFRNEEPLPYKATNIDFALATHVHTDHVGLFPKLAKDGFRGPLYTSFETAKLLPVVLSESRERLEDNFRDMLKKFKNAKKRIKEIKLSQKGRGRRDKPRHAKCSKKKLYKAPKHPEILYEKEDIDTIVKQTRIQNLFETFSPAEGIEIIFYPNAHIAGAVVIVCKVFAEGEEANILFTGDLALTNPVINTETIIPSEVSKKIGVIVCESTYGSSEEERPVSRERLQHMEIIKEAHKHKSTIMYMSNSLERPLRLGVDLKQMQESSYIEDEMRDYRIFFDSTFGIKCLSKYEKLYGTDYLPEGFTVIDKESRGSALASKSSKMIICTSPRFYQGSFINYGARMLEDPNVILIFVAYVPEEVRNIIELPVGSVIEYMGEKVTLRCKRYQFGYYSSHVSTKEMDTFLSQFENCSVLLFNHGTHDSKTNYMKRYKNSKRVTHNLLYGRTVMLTSDGIEKYF